MHGAGNLDGRRRFALSPKRNGRKIPQTNINAGVGKVSQDEYTKQAVLQSLIPYTVRTNVVLLDGRGCLPVGHYVL